MQKFELVSMGKVSLDGDVEADRLRLWWASLRDNWLTGALKIRRFVLGETHFFDFSNLQWYQHVRARDVDLLREQERDFKRGSSAARGLRLSIRFLKSAAFFEVAAVGAARIPSILDTENIDEYITSLREY